VITQFFIQLGTGFYAWFLGLLPDMTDAAGIIVTGENWISTLIASGAALGAWIPWDWVAIVLPIVLTCYITLFVIKIVKNIWAFVPFFGGSG
jgi:hypothetical protein